MKGIGIFVVRDGSLNSFKFLKAQSHRSILSQWLPKSQRRGGREKEV
jgi:hypothetical protein